MKKSYLFVSACILALTSCSNQEPDLVAEKTVVQTSIDLKISPEEAVKNAEKYFAAIQEGTRSANRSSYTLSVIKSDKTRSESGNELPDSLYYLINYENEEGFALMAADKRLPEMLAISEEGNLDLNDTTFNKGLAEFMSSIGTPTLPTDPPVLEKEIIITGKPMLTKTVRKWGQKSPFNDYCPIDEKTGIRSKAGCGPVAAAMIMSFYKYPATYSGTSFNWDNMNAGTDDAGVARLLCLLGQSNNLNCSYSSEGTGANPDNFKRTFVNFNFNFSDARYNFTSDFPTTLLNADLFGDIAHPILIAGYGYYEGESIGHAWVADGVMTVRAVDNSYSKSYVHCVWGWDGKANGYFLYNFDGKLGGTPDEKGAGDTYKGEDDFGPEFNDRLRYWKDFSPKK